jgi:multidrug efflux pump subunit AcrA (membrane-fusion protein)
MRRYQYRTDVVKTEVSLDFVSNGNFEPVQELKFSAEKSGKITKILAKEGDYVSVGQTLAIVRSDVVSKCSKRKCHLSKRSC